MTEHDVLVGFRLRLFTLADELGNVSAACRAMGVDRSIYYRWKANVDRWGLEDELAPSVNTPERATAGGPPSWHSEFLSRCSFGLPPTARPGHTATNPFNALERRLVQRAPPPASGATGHHWTDDRSSAGTARSIGCMASRTLALRRADRCAVCAAEMPAGTRARWDAEPHGHLPGLRGRPDRGLRASALASGPGIGGRQRRPRDERRRRSREQRTRTAHPHIGGLLLALQGEPPHQLAFRRGQHGEAAVAESLRRRTANSNVVLLHDRRMPGGRGNIDHLVIAPTGVYVVDAKDHTGRVSVSTPLFGEPKLIIDGRDRTKLIDGLDRQVAAVRDALATPAHLPAVHGALCFTKADLPLLGTPSLRSHLLLTRKAVARRLNAGGPLSSPAIDEMARALAAAFPRA